MMTEMGISMIFMDVGKDTYEVTRMMAEMDPKFLGKSRASLSGADQKKYDLYLKVKEEYLKQKNQSIEEANKFDPILQMIQFSNDLLKKTYHIQKVDSTFLKTATSDDQRVKQAISISGQLLKMGYKTIDSAEMDLKEGIKHTKDKLNYGLDTAFNPRNMVGDHYMDWKEINYGNANFMGPDALHGTHVSGIIGAIRNNSKGINGIANHVLIMPVRAVPDGDERDKDVANAIRYAVNNGAEIINMSFGKGYSPYKEAVDEAVRYAETKGVLLIHAAGNESTNKDSIANFPNRYYLKGDTAQNWIEVGAISKDTNSTMVASFSNYGKHTVDVFAPGVDIYSTVPNINQYKNESGTSMASPVVVGLAAVLKGYFPYLSALQIKEIILNSAVKYHNLVNLPGSKEKTISFDSLSITGGVANLYQAVKLALTYPTVSIPAQKHTP
jgi:subtilisin family serine protease